METEGTQQKRAWIFANGEQLNLEVVRVLLQPGDYRVAADGGLRHLHRLGIQPDLVVGDLDSLEPGDIVQLKNNGVRIEQHPVHKDETDLELAVQAVLHEGYTTIFVANALGGRLDMSLANILMLSLPELAGIDITLEDGAEEVFLIHPTRSAGDAGRRIVGRAGDRISLLPLGGPARGIFTSGLFYPLHGETLYPDRARGVSNQMIADQAFVSLEEGQLVCIHARSQPERVFKDFGGQEN
jgi:thiamine pyrophosphokinase